MPDDKRLIIVATPIGNLGDLSTRAIEALTAADYWLVEDTRVSGKLAVHLGLKKPMRILNDHTSGDQTERMIKEISKGATVALLTDGGTPVISDPGGYFIDQCYAQGIDVQAVPGPSAPVMALALSGFYGQRFVFLGFLGRKPKDMRRELVPFAESPLTLVLFESIHRIDALLTEAFASLGPRRYAICREMTKSFEQVFRSTLPYVPSEAEMTRKGELTIVLEGLRKQTPM